MKTLTAILLSLAVAGGALYLAFSLAMGTTTGGCATALLQGTLVEHDGALGVESVPPGTTTPVSWPFGYGVGSENGTLTLTRLFSVVAREGEEVSVGGGMAADNVTFAACGPVTLGLMFPPEPSPPVEAPSDAERWRAISAGLRGRPGVGRQSRTMCVPVSPWTAR